MKEDHPFTEYREVTRQSAPTHLVAAVRRRLAQSSLILPRVAFACLGTATTVTAITTFFLVTRQPPQPREPGDPPPLFQSAGSSVFSETAPVLTK